MKKSLIVTGAASLTLAAMPVVGTFADVIDTVTVQISASCGVASDTQSTPGTGGTFSTTLVNGGTYEWAAASTAAQGGGTGGSLYITCNDASGWNVTAQGYSNDVAGTTTMVSTGGPTISTGTTLDGTVSNWAFMLVDDNTEATISTSSWTAVPSNATKVAYKSGSTVSSGHIYTGYKVGISPTQQAGTYTGKVKYVVSGGVGQ